MCRTLIETTVKSIDGVKRLDGTQQKKYES